MCLLKKHRIKDNFWDPIINISNSVFGHVSNHYLLLLYWCIFEKHSLAKPIQALRVKGSKNAYMSKTLHGTVGPLMFLDLKVPIGVKLNTSV